MRDEKLLERRTSVVGTIRVNRREIPPFVSHGSVFYSSSSLNSTVYKAKHNKSVLILSVLHSGAAREGDEKKKPQTVLYMYITIATNAVTCWIICAERRVPRLPTGDGIQLFFFKVLDLAGVNARIIYNMKSGSNISRRKFLFQLSEQLRESEVSRKAAEVDDVCPVSEGRFNKRVTCEVNCKRTRTTTKCTECKCPVCGQCLAGVCTRCKSD